MMRHRFRQFGITRLGRITGLDRIGIPVWIAVRPASRTLAVSQGKGIDDDAAMASAVMEAIEFAVAESWPVPVRRASLAELSRAGISHDPMEALIGRGRHLPDRDEAIAWVDAEDLLGRRPCLVPEEAVRIDQARAPDDPAARYWQSTDGLASGNDRTEAILHGLLERVERDATMLWRLLPPDALAATAVDARAYGDPVLDGMADRIEAAGLRLTLFEITADTAVPVVTAILSPADLDRRTRPLHFDFAGGTGCHPDPVRAALRAVTEAAQSRLTVISGARDDYPPALYTAPCAPGLPEIAALPPARRPTAADPAPAGAAALLDHVLDRIAAAGVRSVLAVPLTAPDEPFAVVKTLVPDLETLEGDRREVFGARALKAIKAQEVR